VTPTSTGSLSPVSDDAAIDLSWGDVIRVSPHADSRYRPAAKASVVGLPEAGGVTAGQRVTIEYEDGSDVEIPVELLKLIARPGQSADGTSRSVGDPWLNTDLNTIVILALILFPIAVIVLAIEGEWGPAASCAVVLALSAWRARNHGSYFPTSLRRRRS
jgi:hypothetical protein